MASLTIVVDGVEQRIPLQSATVTLGRGLESDVRLKDIKASRRHCQIVKTAKGYQCVDLSSGNGTYVNGLQIKTQMLESGDRITIGSTSIAFEDAAPRAAEPAPARPSVSAKAPTAKLPVVAASPAHPAAPKAPEQVPVAPTRRSTARLEAAKSSSQGALKPVSQGALKPVSQGALKPVDTGKTPAAKPGTRVNKSGRLPAARGARPAAEAPRKKSPVPLIAAGAVVVVLLGAGAFLLFGSRDGDDKVRTQIDQFVKKAEKAEKAEHLDEAIQNYKEALERCQGERQKFRASEIKKLVDALEARRSAGITTPASGPKDLHAPEKGPDFQAKKTEIAARHKLAGEASSADWAAALKDWSDFGKGKLPADTRTKVEGEIHALQAKAKDEAERLRKKADGLAQENKMAEAVDLIKQQLERFNHPDLKDLHGELEAALQKYDK
jgi:hypothetical protein